MNKTVYKKMVFAIMFLAVTLICKNSVMATDNLKISSGSAILIEPRSGRVIYQKHALSKVKIASITKLMTGILALENAKPTDIVKISKNAASIGGSRVGLKAGSEVTLDSLLYG